jgi:predicted GNAT family N-acyltransferase
VSVEVRVARAADLAPLLALRHEVFCVEQGVPVELEQDGRERVGRSRPPGGPGRRARRVSLAAQVLVQGFYERQGYISQGEVFMDAGIPHILMDCEL